MDVALGQQPAAHRLTGAALEQHVVRHHDGCPPGVLHECTHVLQEVELLIAGGCPEVGTFHRQGLPFRLALTVDKGQAGLAAEGRVGQHHVVVDAGMGPKAVVHGDVGLVAADAVEVQVHHAQPGRAVHDLPAVQGVPLQVLLLILVHGRVAVNNVVVGGQQKTAGAAGRVADGVVRAGAHRVHDRPDQRSRREILPGAGLYVLGVALHQRLVGVALHVGVHRQPVLAVDELPDQPGQHGRFLDPVLGLAENDSQGARLTDPPFSRRRDPRQLAPE